MSLTTPKVLPLVYWPNPILSKECDWILDKQFGAEIDQLVLDMIATMDANNGVGLAAPQVGVPIQLFIIRIEPENTIVFCNPVIHQMGELEYEWEEGCLSVPGYFEKRNRPAHIEVTYQDVNGKETTCEFTKLYAFAIQHEMDHLEGKVFVDNLSRFKRSRIKSKVKKSIK